jgi:uncharacterized oxidoreductase
MNLSGNTILITGGATGIGLGWAQAFIERGNTVLVCGRRQDKLQEAKAQVPQIETFMCDVADAAQRQELLAWATTQFPALNVLINNAAMQRQIDLVAGADDLNRGDDEIAINFSAPVQLSALFIPHLLQQPTSAIINVSSGLAFVPIAAMPIYCATKAALHSYTMSLRHQLQSTSIQVFEVAPPMVDTELDRGARIKRGETYFGISVEETVRATLEGLENDTPELLIGQSQQQRAKADELFSVINSRR